MVRLVRLGYVLVLTQVSVAFSQNALWLWNTEEIFARPELRDTLLRIRDELDVRDVFLNFPHRFELTEGGIRCVLLQEDSLASLLQWTSSHGFRIFALGGEPEWALSEFAGNAEAFVRAVLRFVRESSPDRSVGGIHLDVEPHLLIQFASSVLRTQLYVNLIHLHEHLADVVRSVPGLEYGADLPFWMMDSVKARGVSAPVVEHILRNVDHTCVMAYRDRAEGVNGILQLADAHVAMAGRLGKQVYVGVETGELQFRKFQFILGRSERIFRAALTDRCRDIPSVLSGGDRIAAVEVFGTVHLGVPKTAASEGLLRLADCFGQSLDLVDTMYVHQKLDELPFWCRHIGEWENPRRDEVIERGGKRFQTFSMVQKALPHVSFSEESLPYFQSEVGRVDFDLRGRSGYRGVAVHDFRGVSSLLLKK